VTQTTEYAFNNRSQAAAVQLACIERYLDPVTAGRLAPPVVRDGDHCWEVGAGGGSVAQMLVRGVGWDGLVVATDIDTSQLMRREELVVLDHDVRWDAPPEGGPFQVIHARLVLLHLPERREVLRRLTEALAPGGWLVVEEFDCTAGPCVLHAPDAAAEKLFQQVMEALLGALEQRGADLGWAQRVHGEMAVAGLTTPSIAEPQNGSGRLKRSPIEKEMSTSSGLRVTPPGTRAISSKPYARRARRPIPISRPDCSPEIASRVSIRL